MGPTRSSWIAECLDDTILLLGASLWLWMIMESLKPGLISFYWNLTTHWIILIIILFLRLVVAPPTEDQTFAVRPPSMRQQLFWGALSGLTATTLLREWGIAAIALGLLISFLSSSLFYHLLYEESNSSA